MLQGLIFDMDGTLTLTEQLHHRAFSQVLKQYNIEYPLTVHIQKYAGAGAKNVIGGALREQGIEITQEELDLRVAEKRDLYKKIIYESDVPVVEGIVKFLETTDEMGLKRIIATGNSDMDIVDHILRKVGLKKYFPQVVSISEVPRGKPFPDVFLEAAKRINCMPADCMVFEDALNGVHAAVDAKIRCIALETTTPRELLKEAGAEYVVKNYNAITNSMLYGK